MRSIFPAAVVFLMTGSIYVNEKRTAVKAAIPRDKGGPTFDANSLSVCMVESLRVALMKARTKDDMVPRCGEDENYENFIYGRLRWRRRSRPNKHQRIQLIRPTPTSASVRNRNQTIGKLDM